MTKDENCQACQKSLVVSYVVNENTEYEYYSLNKDWNGFRTITNKKVCLDCWNKDQTQYKQEWEDITKTKEHWTRGGICDSRFDFIQVQCKEKGCHKKFDPQTAEKLRHKWNQNQRLNFEDHEMLNKNPTPVNTMEDLIKQWMGSMGYQRIYFDNGEMKIKATSGKTLEFWGVALPGTWTYNLQEWLKEQPSKEIINSSILGERERERANFQPKKRFFVPIVTGKKTYLIQA